MAVLPCCLPAVRLFDLVQGQWRVGFGGAYALDYTAVAAVMRDVLCIRKKHRADLLEDVAVMESSALKEMRQHGKS